MVTAWFCGLEIRYTEAIYGRHLYVEGNVLWLGTQGVMQNVIGNLGRDSGDDRRITMRLLDLMQESITKRRSITWSP